MNQIKVNQQQTIVALRERGWSKRRIARELGLDRKTVRRYWGTAAPAKSPANPQTGSEAKSPTPQTGFLTAGGTGPESLCQPWKETIEKGLAAGLSVQRIYQDLVVDHQFAGSYFSVRRFALRLERKMELPFRRIEVEPGAELQVDFGQGAWVVEETGKRRRPHLFRAVLSHSRKAYSEAVWRQTTETFIRCLENAFRYFGGVPRSIITDIAACGRLILVVGPKAITSDYVTQEWQFAYYAANKCVNPIVRLDGRDTQGNKVDGYALIPQDLKLLHAEDFRQDVEYDERLKNLIRQLSESLPPVGKLVAVPELPPGYRAQPERLKTLRDLLLLDLQKPVVVTGAAARVGLQGMGGIGKSVLANALAHHPQVQRAFQDGIYWVTLGQNPQIEGLQRQLVAALGGDAQFNSRHEGKEELRKLLADKAALLILDDVWQREHAEAFNVTGSRSRILLTTRDSGLVTAGRA
ncbi:MAG TPA: NB-ARC domain-containing protein [Verrucomicrobiae bacterium]|nr:NB-ARC domain-containing protein [Verrucomicrobiae bacterium]